MLNKHHCKGKMHKDSNGLEKLLLTIFDLSNLRGFG